MGGVLGVLWWGAAQVWPGAVAAAVVVVADLALTGMLHVDGLADSADGLLPHLPRERRLEVMREPTVGAYAVAAVGVTLLGRWAAFASIRPHATAIALVAALWCTSRTLMASTLGRLPYARAGSEQGGLASAFIGRRMPVWVTVVLAGGAGLVAALWRAPAGPVAVAAAAVAFALVLTLGVRRLGGFSGDVLGAAGVVGETVGLLVAAARW